MAIGFEGVVLVAGLVILWWAGDKAVRYAIEITDLFGVSSFAIGFIVMSVSTGLPELVTAFVSAFTGASGLSAGNLMGASLANITLVLGVATVASGTLAVNPEDEASLLKIMALITAVTSVIFLTSQLTVAHGAILLGGYAASILFLQQGGLMEKVVKEETQEAEQDIAEEPVLSSAYGTAVKFLASLALVVIGAHLAVDSAKAIAVAATIPLETVGATIIAIGTALPELTLELNAVKRKEYALALGDLFGSALVNMSLILGILSVISPTTINTIPLIGATMYIGLTLVFLWKLLPQNHGLERKHGYALIAIFLFYLIEEIGVTQVLYNII